MKPLKVVVLLISALALCACGVKQRSSNEDASSVPIASSTSASSSSSNKPSSSTPSSSASSKHDPVSGDIGPSGGTVKDPDNNVSINIPAGALSRDTKISAVYIDSPEILTSSLSTNFLGAAEFGPDGTVFDKPVQVTINLTETPKSSSLAVFCYYVAEDVWEYVTDAIPNGKKATFEVTHFSTYQVMDRSGDFLNEYENIVNHAQVNGLSDAEIIEEFRDYLVNYKHIMDQYTTYDGYWYEPCGLKINGKYQTNGKSGDPEALSVIEGESNKVGNSYGLSKIDGGISSKDKVKGVSASSEMFDVTVIVEYKIIDPDINLTASKKKLNKGESATINIRCHYTNARNFFPEFKDLDLAGYMLTIAKPTNFTADKSAVLTDSSGRASFVVTAKENNKAETITVNFDVSGNFGTHAEGNITLNSEGISITGHVKEEIDIVWRAPVETMQGSWSVTGNGTFNLVVEYDFEGTLVEEEDKPMTGELAFTDIDVSFSATASSVRGTVEEATGTGEYDFFGNVGNITPYMPSYKVVGTEVNDLCSLYSEDDAEEIATVSGSGNTHAYANVHDIVKYDMDVADTFTIFVRNSDSLLLGFALTPGTETYTSTTFKDKFSVYLEAEGYGMEFENFEEMNMAVVSDTRRTTQTISVA